MYGVRPVEWKRLVIGGFGVDDITVLAAPGVRYDVEQWNSWFTNKPVGKLPMTKWRSNQTASLEKARFRLLGESSDSIDIISLIVYPWRILVPEADCVVYTSGKNIRSCGERNCLTMLGLYLITIR